MNKNSKSTGEYWEKRFKNEGIMWKFFPADSTLFTLELFRQSRINNILIPGFGYGRNGRLFIENGFKVTGIEISGSAIDLARANGINCTIHHGSVNSMPFDDNKYEGIFCFALLHLLNKRERRAFLKSCYDQLKPGGMMVFTVASKQTDLYGKGKFLSRDRYQLQKGLVAYFYDSDSVLKEFSEYGMIEFHDIEEPVKFSEIPDSVKLIYVLCKKEEQQISGK